MNKTQAYNKSLDEFIHTDSINYLIERLSLIGKPINNELNLKIKQAEKDSAISWVNIFMLYICNLQSKQWRWDYKEVGHIFTIEIPTKYINQIQDKEVFVNLFAKFFRLRFVGVGNWSDKYVFNFMVPK